MTPGQARKLRETLEAYQAQRWDDAPAGFYAERGLDYTTVVRFGLGYTGALGRGRTLDLRRCLVLPYEDGLGRLRQLRYRPLYPSKAKYLSQAKEPSNLFAVRALDHPIVHVCEGEIDTMSAWQCGFRAVGLPGANNWKDAWRYLFRPPHVERVVLALDPDKAGRDAARNIYRQLDDVIDVTVAKLPTGLDVNDLLVKGGEDAVREVLEV